MTLVGNNSRDCITVLWWYIRYYRVVIHPPRLTWWFFGFFVPFSILFYSESFYAPPFYSVSVLPVLAERDQLQIVIIYHWHACVRLTAAAVVWNKYYYDDVRSAATAVDRCHARVHGKHWRFVRIVIIEYFYYCCCCSTHWNIIYRVFQTYLINVIQSYERNYYFSPRRFFKFLNFLMINVRRYYVLYVIYMYNTYNTVYKIIS